MNKKPNVKKPTIELLSPAGSYQALLAAVCAGADAVYVGGSKFSARAYADNLSNEELIESLNYLHIHRKKMYLTVNTLIKEKELQKSIYDMIAPLYDYGLDAVIVQDLGLVHFLKEQFPTLSIHASTQMAVTGYEGAAFLEKKGVSRVIPARELSLKEIEKIRRHTNIEIETFVHGALCYSCSGQCLFSSLLGGRSGNRGRCAQPCRLPYTLYESGRHLKAPECPLSMKDMCTLRLLPDIIKTGVCSLKIEGRMKSAEYTAGVTGIYRKYIDIYTNHPDRYTVKNEDIRRLENLFCRDGFTGGYYRRNYNMIASRKTEKTAQTAQSIRNSDWFKEISYMCSLKKLPVMITGRLILKKDKPSIILASCGEFSVALEGPESVEAINAPVTAEQLRQQMLKTGHTDFVFRFLDIYADDNIFIQMAVIKFMRREAIRCLQGRILYSFYRNPVDKIDTSVAKISLHKYKPLKLYALVSDKSQLDAVIDVPGIDGIYAECNIFTYGHGSKGKVRFDGQRFFDEVSDFISRANASGKEAYLAMPYLIRSDELCDILDYIQRLVSKNLQGFLVRNLETYGILSKLSLQRYIVLDQCMYVMSSRAQSFWRSVGVMRDSIPVELNRGEISHRNNTYSDMVVYSRIPLMISRQCPKKNFGVCALSESANKNSCLILEDRFRAKFPVVCVCDFCHTIIYNSVPMSLIEEAKTIKDMHPHAVRISFTIENKKETRHVAELFAKIYKNNGSLPDLAKNGEYTKGHFKRGVE